MTARVEIYTNEDCQLCEKVKAFHGEGNYTEHQAQDLLSGANQDMEAMAQLAMQNMALPLVKINGKWDTSHVA